MFKLLKKVPIPAAVAFMVVCLLLGVAKGNQNALDAALADAEAYLPEIQELIGDRVQSAANLLVLCDRYAADEPWTEALSTVRDSLVYAQKPSDIIRANDQLTFTAQAASEALTPLVTEQDMRLLTGVMDTLASDQGILERVIGAYNEALQEAEAVYAVLPTRMLLSMPEAFQ
ncbi:MAG: hypothetical protein UFE80_09300 [Christensenellales bacterium]|uniref:Uncharacterized protein n=1 Tax=Candidatus Avichristensenella intestinipullorum TaxID=2840693 RepID=A0A9D0YXZ8_9FIRM|nr:hypothetical protein [Christensenellales bacterium]HIQ63940.1 hypothetical protein [Candidatus Avichristensenella intestinipullorum]